MDTTPEESVEITNATECRFCKASLPADQVFCGECGYPENGDDLQKRKWANDMKKLNQQHKESIEQVEKGLDHVKWLGIIFAFYGIVFGVILQDYVELTVQLILSATFLGLYFWGRKHVDKAFSTLLVALVIYATLNLLWLLSGVFSGLIIRIIFLSYLFYGLSNIKKAQKLQAVLFKNDKIKDLITKRTNIQ